MTVALFSALLLVTAAGPGKARNKLDAAQRELSKGDFSAALKLADQALAEAGDPDTIARIHLLRGQAYGAQQDFPKAEDAFGDALGADPEAALDPSRVDPALVKLLDSLRARTLGKLSVKSEPPGAAVSVDGAAAGQTPLELNLTIGRHQVEVKTPSGRAAVKQAVTVRRDHPGELSLQFDESAGPGGGPEGEKGWRPFADLRAAIDPLPLNQGASLEVGGGLEWTYYRASLHARVFPEFGLTPRGALMVPVIDQVLAYVELEAPVIFLGSLALGIGGEGGVEWRPSKWLGVFFQVGGRHFFITPADQNDLSIQAGARLRLP